MSYTIIVLPLLSFVICVITNMITKKDRFLKNLLVGHTLVLISLFFSSLLTIYLYGYSSENLCLDTMNIHPCTQYWPFKYLFALGVVFLVAILIRYKESKGGKGLTYSSVIAYNIVGVFSIFDLVKHLFIFISC